MNRRYSSVSDNNYIIIVVYVKENDILLIMTLRPERTIRRRILVICRYGIMRFHGRYANRKSSNNPKHDS